MASGTVMLIDGSEWWCANLNTSPREDFTSPNPSNWPIVLKKAVMRAALLNKDGSKQWYWATNGNVTRAYTVATVPTTSHRNYTEGTEGNSYNSGYITLSNRFDVSKVYYGIQTPTLRDDAAGTGAEAYIGDAWDDIPETTFDMDGDSGDSTCAVVGYNKTIKIWNQAYCATAWSTTLWCRQCDWSSAQSRWGPYMNVDYDEIIWTSSATAASPSSIVYDGNSHSGGTVKYTYTARADAVATNKGKMSLEYKQNGATTWTVLQADAVSGTSYDLPKVTNVGTYTWDTRAYLYNKEVTNSQVKFTITKGANTIAGKDQSFTKDYSTSAQDVSFTAATGDGAITYKVTGGDTSFTIPDSTKAQFRIPASKATGTYKVTVTATAAGDSNHNSGSASFVLTIIIAQPFKLKIVLNDKVITAVKYKINGGTETTWAGTDIAISANDKLQITSVAYNTTTFPSTEGYTYSIKIGSNHYTYSDTYTMTGNTTVYCNLHLGSFTWYGTDALDNSNIVAGNSIMTASIYNGIIKKMTTIAPVFGATSSITQAAAGASITAVNYNTVAREIDRFVTLMSYTGISTQTETALTSLIESKNVITIATSLKEALNAFITKWNNSI